MYSTYFDASANPCRGVWAGSANRQHRFGFPSFSAVRLTQRATPTTSDGSDITFQGCPAITSAISPIASHRLAYTPKNTHGFRTRYCTKAIHIRLDYRECELPTSRTWLPPPKVTWSDRPRSATTIIMQECASVLNEA